MQDCNGQKRLTNNRSYKPAPKDLIKQQTKIARANPINCLWHSNENSRTLFGLIERNKDRERVK